MNTSSSIANLAEALSKAQGAMRNAPKDSANPFFKSKYADLASVSDACRAELAANGLAVAQLPEIRDGKLVLSYVLMHASGEWISGELEMTPIKSDPQGVGSAITYARRYSLAAITGIATEDDDGNAASGNRGRNDKQLTNRDRQSTTIGESSSSQEPTPPQPASDPSAPQDKGLITDKQRTRMYALVHKFQWNNDDVKKLLNDFGIASSKLIPISVYNSICHILATMDYAIYIDRKSNPPVA